MKVEEILDSIYKIMEDEDFHEGVKRAVQNSTAAVARILSSDQMIQELAGELREKKEAVLSDISHYLELTMKGIEKVNGRAYLAKTPEDARQQD